MWGRRTWWVGCTQLGLASALIARLSLSCRWIGPSIVAFVGSSSSSAVLPKPPVIPFPILLFALHAQPTSTYFPALSLIDLPLLSSRRLWFFPQNMLAFIHQCFFFVGEWHKILHIRMWITYQCTLHKCRRCEKRVCTVYQLLSLSLWHVSQVQLLVHIGSAVIGGKMCRVEQIQARWCEARFLNIVQPVLQKCWLIHRKLVKTNYNTRCIVLLS